MKSYHVIFLALPLSTAAAFVVPASKGVRRSCRPIYANGLYSIADEPLAASPYDPSGRGYKKKN